MLQNEEEGLREGYMMEGKKDPQNITDALYQCSLLFFQTQSSAISFTLLLPHTHFGMAYSN